MRELTEVELAAMSPAEMRALIRRGDWTEADESACLGYWKANLAVIPEEYAYEFFLFCQRNSQACAVGAATEPGNPCPEQLAKDADLRTDLPRYRVFHEGQLIDEPTDVLKYWRDDLVAFLMGAMPNVTLAFQKANVRYRLVGGYMSTIPCVPAGPFHGNMAVTCSIFKTSRDAVRAIQISSRYPDDHGPPVHISDPTAIGITDLGHPDISTLIHFKNLQHPEMLNKGFVIEPGEIPMFWGAGVTPQSVAIAAKVPFMITHFPAHLFISDKLCEEFAVL